MKSVWYTTKLRKNNKTKWQTSYEKVTTFEFRVGGTVMRKKTPDKAQTTG